MYVRGVLFVDFASNFGISKSEGIFVSNIMKGYKMTKQK